MSQPGSISECTFAGQLQQALNQAKIEQPNALQPNPNPNFDAGLPEPATQSRGRNGKPRVKIEEPSSPYDEMGDGRVYLKEDDMDFTNKVGNTYALAKYLSSTKKWIILAIIFIVQCSMNFNTSLYANGQTGMAKEFGVPVSPDAVHGAALFLTFYAFGCELWAPWSEEFGRFIVLQLSLLFVNLFAIGAALSINIPMMAAFRSLGGLASAGGSVTLGIVADMYGADDQQNAVSFVVLSSVGGSVFGPIIGGFVEESTWGWRWTIWLQLIAGVVVQSLHFVFVPETRSTATVSKYAKLRRKADPGLNVYGPNDKHTLKQRLLNPEGGLTQVWLRPFIMLYKEKIVLILSLLSGFSDALIFLFFQTFDKYFKTWSFKASSTGLTFVGIGIGYIVSWLLNLYANRRNRAFRATNPNDETAQFESRLLPLLWTGWMLPVGIFGFAWTNFAAIPWMVPVFFGAMVGVANYAVYNASIDYTMAAYGPYSASATGGNGFCRDLFAGLLTYAADPFFNALKPISEKYQLHIGLSILGGVSLLLVGSAIMIYYKGPSMRDRSPWATRLGDEGETVTPHVKGSEVTFESRGIPYSRQQSPSGRGRYIKTPEGSRPASIHSLGGPTSRGSRPTSDTSGCAIGMWLAWRCSR